MRYRVSGADRTTGQDITRTIDAPSKSEAEKIAARSMLVSGVALGDEPKPPALDYAGIRTEADRLGDGNGDDRAELRGRLSAGAKEPIPNYGAILLGASLLRVLAALSAIGGALELVAGILALAASGAGIGERLQAEQLISSGVMALVGAAVLGMLAALGAAIRDMARNSFVIARRERDAKPGWH